MKHLSAESALYCRVITEGLLGIEPTGFSTFTIQPKMPKAWNTYSLDNLALAGGDLSIDVTRTGKKLRIIVHHGDMVIQNEKITEGDTIEIKTMP